MKELADTIKRFRGIDESFSGEPTMSLVVRDAIRASCHPQAIQAINQLVELVAEMRGAMKENVDWHTNNYGSSELCCTNIEKLTKADALLEGLK